MLGSRWVPYFPAPWRVFGDFLHEQKVTRRRHVPLVETGRPVRRGDVGIAPYGWGGGTRDKPNSGPAKRAEFGEEEQRNE